MSLTHQLHEGLSNLVYHFTAYQNIIKILEEDRLVASSAMANVADGGSQNRNKHFYVSFQRSRSAKIGYAGNTGGSGSCIEFDGQALNAKYKGTAIDYWGRGKDPHVNGLGKSGVMSSNELEDRLVVDTPIIPHIRRYIKSIHVTVWENGSKETYEKLERYCKRLAIPIYFYATSDDFRLGRKEKAVPLDSIEVNTPEGYGSYDPDARPVENALDNMRLVTTFMVYRDPGNKELLEKTFTDPRFAKSWDEAAISQLSYRYLTKGYDGYDEYYIKELKNLLYAEVSNFRTSKNPYLITFSQLLSKELRRYKANNVIEWVDKKLAHMDAAEKAKKDAEDEAHFTEYIGIWIKERANEYDDISRDKVEGMFYPEVFQEEMEKYVRTKAGRAAIQEFVTDKWWSAEMMDLLTLLGKVMDRNMVQHFLAKHDMRPITKYDKSNSRTTGRYIHLTEATLGRYVSNFLQKILGS